MMFCKLLLCNQDVPSPFLVSTARGLTLLHPCGKSRATFVYQNTRVKFTEVFQLYFSLDVIELQHEKIKLVFVRMEVILQEEVV